MSFGIAGAMPSLLRPTVTDRGCWAEQPRRRRKHTVALARLWDVACEAWSALRSASVLFHAATLSAISSASKQPPAALGEN